MVKTRSQMEHKTIYRKQKAKPSSKKLKPLIEEKNYFMAKINMFSSFQVIEDIKKKLTPRQRHLFSKTCFGQFLNLERVYFSGQLVHQILLRQLDSAHTDENGCIRMMFAIGGKQCEFGLRDFALITGLDCGEFVELTVDEFQSKLSNGIRDKFFSGKEKVWCKDVARAFWSCENDDDDEDILKLAQLYLLEGFLLSKEPGKACHDFSIELVDNSGEFNKFPWGRYVYERMADSTRRVFKKRANRKSKYSRSKRLNSHYDTSYHLKGFPYAIQYWAYECFPWIGENFGNRIGADAPRMLNWGDNKRPNFKTLDNAFKRGEFQVKSGIKPTEREMGLGYFRYFLGQQKPKKAKKTDAVEEESPISQEEEQPATVEKTCKQKGVNCDKGKYARVEWIDDLRSEIIASVPEEIRKIATEEIRKIAREEIRKIATEEIRKIARDQMNEDMTQLLNKHLCKATESVPDVVHIEMDEDDEEEEEDDDDGDDDKGSVQRKRKRSMSELEDEIPCFTFDLFQHPHRDDKAEFDEWIEVDLKKNNKKMKYSNAANKLYPAFDFTIMKCDKKDWFFSLNESEEWLSSTHIDVALYYIRKKKNNHLDVFKRRSTTTDSLFYAILNATYEKFKKDPENFYWGREGYICKTLQGIEPRLSVPWVEVDFVYIPVNVNKKHWVAAAVDLRERRINVYDSFRNAKHDKEVVSACLPIAEMLPWILNSEGHFGTPKDIKEGTLPLDVKLVDGLPEQENGGDCGMFMLKFIEFLIQDMPLDGCNQKAISFFRNKMAVELYLYGKKRISKEN